MRSTERLGRFCCPNYALSMANPEYHRLYKTAAWRRLRASVLADEPLCRYCADIGMVSAATVVDHIQPHRGDLALFHEPTNLQPLCKPCHDRHAARKDSGNAIAGHDASGQPLDPDHPWNG